MTTETITTRVDARAAQAFNTASDDERRKLETLISLRLVLPDSFLTFEMHTMPAESRP